MVKEFNEEQRTNWHPANNHHQRNEPSEEELQLTQRLKSLNTLVEAPLIIMGWQYCKSCFDIIARVTCEDCLWERERTIECTHLPKQQQADPSCEMCNWCYFQLLLLIIDRGGKPQSGKKCEKCNKVTNMRVLTYQDDIITIICEDCQRERIEALRRDIFVAYSTQMERDLLAASEAACIDE